MNRPTVATTTIRESFTISILHTRADRHWQELHDVASRADGSSGNRSPTIAAIGVFFFVRSMVTLSAVIFLFTPSTQLAAVSVLLLDDSGNQNQAAAFSVCIMLIVAIALVVFRVLGRMAARYAAARQQA